MRWVIVISLIFCLGTCCLWGYTRMNRNQEYHTKYQDWVTVVLPRAKAFLVYSKSKSPSFGEYRLTVGLTNNNCADQWFLEVPATDKLFDTNHGEKINLIFSKAGAVIDTTEIHLTVIDIAHPRVRNGDRLITILPEDTLKLHRLFGLSDLVLLEYHTPHWTVIMEFGALGFGSAMQSQYQNCIKARTGLEAGP